MFQKDKRQLLITGNHSLHTCTVEPGLESKTSLGTQCQTPTLTLDIQDWRLRIFHCWKGALLFWLRLSDLDGGGGSRIFFLCPSLILDVTIQVLSVFYLLLFWRFWWGCCHCDRAKTKSTSLLRLSVQLGKALLVYRRTEIGFYWNKS